MIKERKYWVRIGLLALALLPGVAWAGDDGLLGNWARVDGTTRVAITQCGSDFCAVNTWVKDPDGSQKVGDKLILKVTPASGTVLKGQAYDVKRKATYNVTITVNGNAMQISGCVLLGIVCKAADWTRLN